MSTERRILIADIDDDFLTRTEVLFEDKGYHTTTAWGGLEAIHKLQSEPFDLLLLSDYLPDVSDERLWRAVEQLPVRPSVAILETAQTVKMTANHYQRLGGRCFLSKDSPYKIVEAVHQCLGSGEHYALNSGSNSIARNAKLQPPAAEAESAN